MPTEPALIEEPFVRRAEHVAWRQIGAETIVLDLTGKEMFGLNGAGGRLWRTLYDGVLAVASVGPDEIEFLAQLQDLGLIVACQAAADLAPDQPSDPPRETAELEESPEVSKTEKPAIVWREAVEQAAATCAFLPGQNILCNSAPFS